MKCSEIYEKGNFFSFFFRKKLFFFFKYKPDEDIVLNFEENGEHLIDMSNNLFQYSNKR